MSVYSSRLINSLFLHTFHSLPGHAPHSPGRTLG
jgi:hypothetical protein